MGSFTKAAKSRTAMANDEEEAAKIMGEPGAVPGSLRHEMSQNGSQSQSATEPEKAATPLTETEMSLTAPPEAQSPGEPQFSMEPHAPEGTPPEITAPEPGASGAWWRCAISVARKPPAFRPVSAFACRTLESMRSRAMRMPPRPPRER